MTLTFSKSVGNNKLMQKINKQRVLNYIRGHDLATRQDIIHETGISASAVTNIVNGLISRNFVLEQGARNSSLAGRKAKLLQFNPSIRKIVCVYIDSAFVVVALADLAGNTLASKKLLLEGQPDDQSILDRISREIDEILALTLQPGAIRTAGIGISLSGMVLNHAQLVLSTKMQWKSVAVKSHFENTFNLPVYVQNNTRTKIMHELPRHLEKDDDRIIFVDLSVGIGIASFVSGRLDESILGELGHTTIEKDGLLCFCGNRGCLEMYCNVDAVLRQCRQLLEQGLCPVLRRLLEPAGSVLSYETILDALHQGDPDVLCVIKSCGAYLGIALANIISLFKPTLILINGERLLAEESIFFIAVSEAGKRINDQLFASTRIARVHINLDSEIKGIALYITDKLCAGPLLDQESF